jgi:hypothetical protein
MDKINLIKKITDAVTDMQSKVEFIDEKRQHRYQVRATGEWLQGVSSVSSIVPKDWLAPWGAKEACKFLGYSDYEGDTERAQEVMEMIVNGMTLEEYMDLLKEAKGAHGRKSKTALIDGKAGHEWLEGYVKAKIEGTVLPEVPKGSLGRPITQFLAWEAENVDYWILSEAIVAYPEKKYCGTLDGLAMLKNGKLALIDFKFSSHISEDYFLQCAGYQATFEPYDIKIDNRIIIRLPKTLEREEWDEVNHKYIMVANDLEVKILNGSYDWDRDIFFHCLPLKTWINQYLKKF